jgi:hypothetical protein
MNGNRKVTLLYKSRCYEEKRSRKKGKLKKREGENEKPKKKGKSSRKTRKKVIQSRTVCK